MYDEIPRCTTTIFYAHVDVDEWRPIWMNSESAHCEQCSTYRSKHIFMRANLCHKTMLIQYATLKGNTTTT